MEPNKLIKDKNKLLMAIPVILGILFLYVFFIREDGNVPSGSDRQAASQAFLEPQSEMADKVNDKMEAYKQDKLEEQEKARILKESQVKGSDFYFELQNQQERYDRATLERIRRMQGLLAHFTQIYHLYNLLIYNILRRNLQLFITEFCIFSPCIIFISNKNSDKSIEILHISPKYITSVDNLMIHIFSSTFNFLYSFTPSDRLESKS